MGLEGCSDMGAISGHNPVWELDILTGFQLVLCSFVQGAFSSLDNLMGEGA